MTDVLITSSVLIAVIALLRSVLRDRIRPGLQYALWGLVLLRLLVPVSWFESPVSVANAAEPIVQQVQHYSAENTRTVTVPVTMGEIPETGEPNKAIARTDIAPLDIARWVWLGGAAVLAAWFLFVNVRLAWKLSRERKLYSKTHKIPVYVTKTLPSPCLYLGEIYLTEEAAADPERAEYIIAHELTHRRHLDGVWSALRVVCLAVYWFNPLVWLAAVLSRRDCELFCDAATVKRLGEDHRFDYGRTLLDLTAVNVRPGDLICSATTMSGSGKSLKERIARIAQNRKTSALLGVVVILIAAVAVGCTFSGGETEDAAVSSSYTATSITTLTEDNAIAFYTDYLATDLESFEAAEEYIWYDSEYTRQLSKENYHPLVYAAVLDTQMLNDNLCALQVELQSRPERPLETVIHYVGLTNGRLYIFKNSFIIPEDLRNGLENLTLETSPTEEEVMYVDGSYWDEVNEVFGPFLEPVDVAVYMSDYYTPMETSDLTLEEFVNMTDGWEFNSVEHLKIEKQANFTCPYIRVVDNDGRELMIREDYDSILVYKDNYLLTEISLGDTTGNEFLAMLLNWAANWQERQNRNSDDSADYTVGKPLVGEYKISALSKDFVLSSEWGYGTAEAKDWFTGEVIALKTDWRRTFTDGKSTVMLVSYLCQDPEDPTILRHREVYDAALAEMTYLTEDTEYDNGFEIYETTVNDYPAFVSVHEVGTYDSEGTQIDTNTEMSIVWADDKEGRHFGLVINDASTNYFSIAELTALAESVVRVN